MLLLLLIAAHQALGARQPALENYLAQHQAAGELRAIGMHSKVVKGWVIITMKPKPVCLNVG